MELALWEARPHARRAAQAVEAAQARCLRLAAWVRRAVTALRAARGPFVARWGARFRALRATVQDKETGRVYLAWELSDKARAPLNPSTEPRVPNDQSEP